MAAAIRAGLLYFLGTFAIGFALGTVRTLLLVPRFGAFAAVAMEVPLMLLASWWVCGVVLRRWPVPPARLLRLTMGAWAFLLLMGAELALAVWGFGQSSAAYWAGFAAPAAQLGLAGQVGFALMPLFRRRV
jgi:hypothetical protein